MTVKRRSFLRFLAGFLPFAISVPAYSEEPRSRNGLKEPLLRTSKRSTDRKSPAPPDRAADDTVSANDRSTDKQPDKQRGDEHPLDEALAIAEAALKHIRDDIKDYKCVIVKRERVQGKLGEREFMYAKIRNRKVVDDKVVVPFAVYLYFAKPESLKGRECAYVEGQNDGKFKVREGGLTGKLIPVLSLNPDGLVAMRGNLYPITEIGLENLIVKLIEKGERDRKRDECRVEFRENATINDRPCRLMEVIHPVRRPYFEFNLAQIYIDTEFNLPVRYASYSWPAGKDNNPNPKPGDSELMEEYTYMKLELNPGFKNADFTIKD